MVFANLTKSNKALIKDMISTSILYFEPRVTVESIDIDDSQLIDGKIEIQLVYEIKGTNSRKNMVYPFYLTEGTDI
jgi:phage baseplate assembly protein W